jgi:predicted metal-dependent enzyme (double-stranded beta helix superfamily)
MRSDSLTTTATPALRDLIRSVRSITHAGWSSPEIARRVADTLRPALADPELLTEEHCRDDDRAYRQHVLHVEDDGSFSIVSLVWLPGQSTPIHDHVSWCVPGVYRGRETETRYRLEEDAESGAAYLVESGRQVNETLVVSALCPPGDIHRVANAGPETAISIHIYGADIAALGSSIRRCYDLEVRSNDGH